MTRFQPQSRTGLAQHFQSHPHPGGIIVCEQPRFIYMKPPRTGGTSILRLTLEKLPLDIFHYKNHPDRFNEWLAGITDADLEDYYIFTFVRNPWDRAVSIASYFRIPFHSFAHDYHKLVAQNENLLQHSLPLHLYANNGQQLFADFVGRFENLQADFDRLCDLLELPRSHLPRSSRSAHGPYEGYYDADTKHQIDQLYQVDADSFGYRFGQNR